MTDDNFASNSERVKNIIKNTKPVKILDLEIDENRQAYLEILALGKDELAKLIDEKVKEHMADIEHRYLLENSDIELSKDGLKMKMNTICIDPNEWKEIKEFCLSCIQFVDKFQKAS